MFSLSVRFIARNDEFLFEDNEFIHIFLSHLQHPIILIIIFVCFSKHNQRARSFGSDLIMESGNCIFVVLKY